MATVLPSIALYLFTTKMEPGPNGGIVHLEDDTIYKKALDILAENEIVLA